MMLLTLQLAFSTLSFFYKSPTILPKIQSIPEFETAWNANLDLAVAMSKDNRIAEALDPTTLEILQDVSSYVGRSESPLVLLSVLEDILKIPSVEPIISSYPTYPLALFATKLLAITITEDFRLLDMSAANWKGLLAITRMETISTEYLDCKDLTAVSKDCAVICDNQKDEETRYLKLVNTDLNEIRAYFWNSVPTTASSALRYLQMGFLLKLPLLMQRSHEVLEKALSMENVVKIYQTSIKTENTDLKELAEDFLLFEFENISKEHKNFPLLKVEELFSLLTSEKLNVTSEISVFHAIVRWVRSDLTSRKEHVTMLMKTVRLHLCSLSQLNVMLDHHLLTDLKPVQHSIRSAIYLLELKSPNLPALVQKQRRNLHETLFVIGRPALTTKTTIETLSISEQQWIAHQSLNYGPVQSISTVSIGKTIYTFSHGDFNISSFEPFKKEWKLLSSEEVTRSLFSLTVLNDLIYVLSGRYNNTLTNKCDIYDPKTGVWTELPNLTQMREYGAAATLKGKIYMAGGHDGKTFLQTVEVFDPKTKLWTFIKPMSYLRADFALVAEGGNLWAFGGRNTAYIASVDSFNPETGVWTVMPPMTVARGFHTAVFYSGSFYVIGGNTVPQNVEIYNPRKKLWTRGPDLKYGRYNFGACVIQNLPNAADFITYEEE